MLTELVYVKFSQVKLLFYYLEQNNQEKLADVDLSTVVVNSIIEAGINMGKESVVSHCHLQVLSRTCQICQIVTTASSDVLYVKFHTVPEGSVVFSLTNRYLSYLNM